MARSLMAWRLHATTAPAGFQDGFVDTIQLQEFLAASAHRSRDDLASPIEVPDQRVIVVRFPDQANVVI